MVGDALKGRRPSRSASPGQRREVQKPNLRHLIDDDPFARDARALE